MRRTQHAERFILSCALSLLFSGGPAAAAPRPDSAIRFRVTPDESGASITVRAEFALRGRLPYLKDFGQGAAVQWFVDGRPVQVKAERMRDNLAFRGLPSTGSALAVFTLKAVTRPTPGYRKRLMGGPGFIMARAGLFLCLVGSEEEQVSVEWDLPRDWELALGTEGPQTWLDTQKGLWVAARRPVITEKLVQGTRFRIAVLEGAGERGREKIDEAARQVFEYAVRTFGPPAGREVGMALFPLGSIGGGTALGTTIATEDDYLTAVHELLHLWTNPFTPAWFREGVHTYMSARLLRDLGILKPREFELFLQACVEEHKAVAEREGGARSLAESSKAYDRGAPGGDMYGLMPLLAYKLDREIERGMARGGERGGARAEEAVEDAARARSRAPAGLEKVFAVVCRGRTQRFDLPALIRKETGYDIRPLFREYFDRVVLDPEGLIKD